MSIDSVEVASDDTDRLCDETIELIGSFSRMLAKARAAREAAAAASSACPCGRSAEQHQQQSTARHRPVVSSNASNLNEQGHVVQQPGGSRVLTSPNEIRLLLRLESWIGDNGMLVVKPSLHREQPADVEGCCSFGNNSTLQLSQGPQCNSGSIENVAAEDCGTGFGDAGGGDGDCFYEASQEDEDETEPAQQQAPKIVEQPAEQPAEQRLQRRSLKSRKEPQEQQPEPPVSSSVGKSTSRQQLLQQRRERLPAKRSASVTKATVGGRTRREAAAAAATPATESQPKLQQQQQQLPRRRQLRSAGDSATLIQKLHKLLNAELKRSG